MERDSSQKGVLIRPKVSSEEAREIVLDLYGLKVNTISELNGYDDKNYHITVDNLIDDISDSGFVLKIVNSLDSQDDELFEAQTNLLIHLNKHKIRCTQPVFTKDQKPFHKVQLSSGEHIVKLLEFIPGEIIFKVQATPKLLYDVGVLTARIDVALKTFDHPAYNKKIKWCLGSAPDILTYLDAVKDTNRQNLVKRIIDEFSSRVLKIENRLDKGLIHGDINEQNILVEKSNNEFNLKAIIDFGDTHYACYLFELAIAMTYMIFTSKNVDSGGFVLAGYSSAKSVPEEELQLLRICVLTRFCQSLVLGAHASLQEPDNEYILTTGKKGWELLEAIDQISEDVLLERWLSVKT